MNTQFDTLVPSRPKRLRRSPVLPLTAGVILLSSGFPGMAAGVRLAQNTGRAANAATERISVNFKDTAVSDVALTISKISGRDVVLSRELTGTVTASLKDKTIDEVLRAVVTAIGADFLRIGDVYYIASTTELRSLASRMGDRRLVTLTKPSPTDVQNLLTARFPYMTVTSQPNPKAVLMVGRPEDLDAGEKLIERMEAGFVEPSGPVVAPEPMVQEVISLKHIAMEEALDALKTAAPNVQSTGFGRGKAVVVTATARETAFARRIIETIDIAAPDAPIQMEMRIYRVKYVSASTAEKTLKGALPTLNVTVAPENYSPPTGVLNPISISGTSSGGGSSSGGGGGGGFQAPSGQGQNQSDSGGKVERASRLVLQGDKSLVERALQILQDTDVKSPQVEIEARVVEISPQDSSKVGIDWTSAGQIFAGLAIGGGFKTSILTRGNPGFNGAVDALITKRIARLMAHPRTVVTDNEDASIFIGDLVRYTQTQSSQNGTTFQTESIPVGITLLVRPRVNADGDVTLKIHPAVSTITGFVSGVPQTSNREIDTTVRLKDGDTFAIGGLIRDDEFKTLNKVPLLGDLPILGQFFRSNSKDRRKTEVVILIRAKLVD
jgi:type II secretory pathway component GspD/PulD (secretin)